jgi:hypothetical protein
VVLKGPRRRFSGTQRHAHVNPCHFCGAGFDLRVAIAAGFGRAQKGLGRLESGFSRLARREAVTGRKPPLAISEQPAG